MSVIVVCEGGGGTELGGGVWAETDPIYLGICRGGWLSA